MKFEDISEDKIKAIAREYEHRVHKRDSNTFEIVRMVGDIIDSRMTIQYCEGAIEVIWYVYDGDEGRNVISDTFYSDEVENFYEEVKKALIKMTRKFKILCIEKDEDFNEW